MNLLSVRVLNIAKSYVFLKVASLIFSYFIATQMPRRRKKYFAHWFFAVQSYEQYLRHGTVFKLLRSRGDKSGPPYHGPFHIAKVCKIQYLNGQANLKPNFFQQSQSEFKISRNSSLLIFNSYKKVSWGNLFLNYANFIDFC